MKVVVLLRDLFLVHVFKRVDEGRGLWVQRRRLVDKFSVRLEVQVTRRVYYLWVRWGSSEVGIEGGGDSVLNTSLDKDIL